MRATIHEHVEGKNVRDHVPKSYQGLIPHLAPSDAHTIVMFGLDRNDVTNSGTVKKALRRLRGKGRIVVNFGRRPD